MVLVSSSERTHFGEDEEFLADFLELYRFFLKPRELHELLQGRYRESTPSLNRASKSNFQYQTVSVYQNWIANYLPDAEFFPFVLEDVRAFARRQIQGAQIRELLALLDVSQKVAQVPPILAPEVVLADEGLPSLIQIDPRALAGEITLYYQELYRGITAGQLALFYSSEDVRRFCPSVACVYDWNEKVCL